LFVVVVGEVRIERAGVKYVVAVWVGSRQAPPWIRLLGERRIVS
jgi:hypothetical protein